MSGETLRKILVIEEQTDTRELFIQGLEARGFDTISADNGQAGLQQAKNHLPDLITCGILVPDLDGYSVLSMLRQHPSTAIIPFIFVTPKMTRTDLRKAMELGANDYLTKPCTVEELARAIVVQLEKQSLLRQWYAEQPGKPDKQPDRQSDGQPDRPATIRSDNTTHSTSFSRSMDLSEPPVSEVFRFIEANYHRPITLSDVAQAVGYSPAYLTHLVGRQTGQTVQRWIIERRMAAARALLVETDQAVEQIATQVGYHHAVHFFRQFRQFHSTTPQAWRNAHRR